MGLSTASGKRDNKFARSGWVLVVESLCGESSGQRVQSPFLSNLSKPSCFSLFCSIFNFPLFCFCGFCHWSYFLLVDKFLEMVL